jgi:hypothetical protein
MYYDSDQEESRREREREDEDVNEANDASYLADNPDPSSESSPERNTIFYVCLLFSTKTCSSAQVDSVLHQEKVLQRISRDEREIYYIKTTICFACVHLW